MFNQVSLKKTITKYFFHFLLKYLLMRLSMPGGGGGKVQSLESRSKLLLILGRILRLVKGRQTVAAGEQLSEEAHKKPVSG